MSGQNTQAPRLTARENDELKKLYSDMKAAHFELKQTTGKETVPSSPIAKELFPANREIGKKEHAQVKEVNKHSSLPFAKDQKPAIAIPDGLFGSSMYQLK